MGCGNNGAASDRVGSTLNRSPLRVDQRNRSARLVKTADGGFPSVARMARKSPAGRDSKPALLIGF
jgi:hypothetical protein